MSLITKFIRLRLLKLKFKLNHIGQNDFFKPYNSKKFKVFDLINLILFKSFLQKSAPILLKTLKSLFESNKTNYEINYETYWLLIISILNFSQCRNWYLNLSILLDVHLFFKDLRTRELDLLNRFDIIINYKIVHKILKQLSKEELNNLI